MRENYIWGNLNKAVNDPTIIDQAIETAVNAHNDDPDAHLGADQALQSHRAAEIIDHLAESVVNDKIKANARTYLAIVDPNGDGDYTTLEDACDYAYTKGSGSIHVKKGTYTPARDLKLKYGIDIYGEGPDETTIDLSATTFKSLNVSGDGTIVAQPVDHIYYYVGDDRFDWYMDGFTLDDLDGVYMITSFGEGCVGVSGVYPIRNTFWDSAPQDGEETDVAIEPTINASTSSDIVHVNGWRFCSGLENGAGLIVASEGTQLGYFETYLGNGDIKLTANSWDTVGRARGVVYLGPAGRMSIIQGVSFGCDSNPYIFHVAGNKGRLYVRDASFYNVAGIFKNDNYYNTEEGAGVTIEDSTFLFIESAVNLSVAGATIRNCTLSFPNYSYPVAVGGVNSYFENCNFRGSLGGVSNKLVSVQRDSRFNGCVFTNMTNGNVVNNGSWAGSIPSAYVLFVGCTFTVGTNRPCVFTGNNIVVTGCRFYSAGANVGLNSTTRYSTFTACQGRGTLLAQPTNCIVTANGIWPDMS